MKHLVLAAVIGLVFCSTIWAQPEILWSQTYNNAAEAEVCNDLIVHNDNLFYVAGNSRQSSHHTCMLTMYVNNEGDIGARFLYGSSEHLLCNAIVERPDGDILLAGSLTLTQSNPHRDGYLRVAHGNDSISAVGFGSDGVDQFNSVLLDTSGTVVLAGNTSSYGAGESDFWLVTTNPPHAGAINRTFGGGETEECNEILLTDDMGFLLAGTTKSYGPGLRNMYIIKTNSLGDSLWSRVIGGSGSQECNAAVKTFDGGFALAGHWNYEFSLVRTDSEGILLWSRIYEGFECHDLAQTRDGGFLLVGDIWSGGDAEWDGRIVRTDCDGNVLWNLTVDKDIDDHLYAAALSPDGSFICGGYTNAPDGPDQLWLVKLDIESPIIIVDRSSSTLPVVRWLAPMPGNYTIYSTTDPNQDISTLPGPGWTWEETLPNLSAGTASWSDQGALENHKYYVVTRSTL